MKKNKNIKIQILRGLAIIAVVMIHTCPKSIVQVYTRPFINFAVATFLFLSGYLTDISKINIKEFYKRRITRVLIPYIIWSVLYTTVGFISNGINFKRYIVNFLTAGGAPTMYYIFVYIQFVILTPLLGKLLKNKYWYIVFFVSPIALSIKYYWLFTGITPNKYVSIIYSVCCLGWLTFYYLGLYLKNTTNKPDYNIKKLSYIYVVTIIIQIVEGYFWYKFGDANYGTQLKLSSLLTSSIFLLISYNYINSNNFKDNYKIMALIGDYSFGIYISHCMVIKLLDKILPFYNFIPFGFNTLIVLLITLLCTIIGKKICGNKISKYLGLY